MKPTRTLVLAAERLADLTPDTLASVAAGAPPEETYSCPDYTYYCLTGYAMCRSTRLICA